MRTIKTYSKRAPFIMRLSEQARGRCGGCTVVAQLLPSTALSSDKGSSFDRKLLIPNTTKIHPRTRPRLLMSEAFALLTPPNSFKSITLPFHGKRGSSQTACPRRDEAHNFLEPDLAGVLNNRRHLPA